MEQVILFVVVCLSLDALIRMAITGKSASEAAKDTLSAATGRVRTVAKVGSGAGSFGWRLWRRM